MYTLIIAAATLVGFIDEPATTLAASVSTERLMETIAALPTRRSGRGTAEHHAGLAQTRDLLVQRLQAMGLEPKLEEVFWKPPGWDESDGQPPSWHNIIVDFAGTERPDEVLILSAHYDAVPAAPGADDDGTGVAAILEIARLLSKAPTKCGVRLILFTLEEVGLVGSTQHCAGYQQDVLWQGKETPIGMVSFDMLGYFTTEPDSQTSPIPPIEGVFEPPTVGDFIALAGLLAHQDFIRRFNEAMIEGSPGLKTVAVDFLPLPVPDLMRSDHAPFIAIGVPAAILSDTANFRSPHYHQPTDTIETIDQQRFTDVVQGLVYAAYTIAEPVSTVDQTPQ